MATSIQVQEKTLNLLKQQKKRLKLATYDEVIRVLAKKKEPLSQNMFGIDRDRITPFEEADRFDFHADSDDDI